MFFFFFKQKTAYEMRISDWSSDVCSSDLHNRARGGSGTRRFARASEAGTQIYTAASGRQLAARPSGMGHHCGGADGILDSLWGRIQQFTERTSRMTALATNSKIWLTPRWRSLARYLTLFVAVLAVSILLTDPAHAQAADGVTS